MCSCDSWKTKKLIPADVKFDPTSNPPQFSDNEGQVIEKGAHVRLKLVGTRSDVGKMSAIGSVKEVSIFLRGEKNYSEGFLIYR